MDGAFPLFKADEWGNTDINNINKATQCPRYVFETMRSK